MINKYAEIQKRIILYKAASGVLRVKLAGGEAKRLRQAVRLEPGGVDFIKELNIIRNNPSELRALVAAAAADPSSFTPAQASLINRYGQMYLPKGEFKPAFSPGEISRFEADSARRLQPNQALRSDMQQFANNNSKLLTDQRAILSNPSLMNDPAAALKSSRLAAEQAAAKANSTIRANNVQPKPKKKQIMFDPTKFTMQPDFQARKQLKRNVRQIRQSYPAWALTMDPRQLDTTDNVIAKLHALNAVNETANKPSTVHSPEPTNSTSNSTSSTSKSTSGTSKSTSGTSKPTSGKQYSAINSLLHNKYTLPVALGTAALGTAAGGYYLANRNKRKDISPYIIDNNIN